MKKTRETIEECLATIDFGKCMEMGDITAVPLYRKTIEQCSYTHSRSAFKKEELQVEEIDDSGNVNMLKATNTGKVPILLVEGEGLRGAKQDRIVNISIIMSAGQKLGVPVSCVEQRRWRFTQSKKFGSAFMASRKIRHCVKESVNRSIEKGEGFQSDQHKVWEEVDDATVKFSVSSNTRTLNDVYESEEDKMRARMKKAPYPEGATGIVLFTGGKIVSIDHFAHPELMKRFWDEILQSAMLECGGSSKREKICDHAELRKEISSLFSSFHAGIGEPEKSPGQGEYVRVRGDGIEGGALVDGNTVAHLSCYRQ